MNVLQAAVLGIVQGLGEFLPISSSAHLIAIPWLIGWQDHPLSFDVALHLGTLIAVVIYYRTIWIQMVLSVVHPSQQNKNNRTLLFYLIIATIPGAIFGYFGEHWAEEAFRSPLLIAGTMSILGCVLWYCDYIAKKNTKTLADINWSRSLLIGLSQGFAIIPGFSRAGITISTALALGYKRQEAARFSFLMSVPIITGAVILKLPEMIHNGLDITFWVGVGMSAIIGYAAIAFLIKYVSNKSYAIFVLYRLVFATVILSVLLMRKS